VLIGRMMETPPGQQPSAFREVNRGRKGDKGEIEG